MARNATETVARREGYTWQLRQPEIQIGLMQEADNQIPQYLPAAKQMRSPLPLSSVASVEPGSAG